jgi:[ribosomal protein S18]-alanine N-acetyltransferase
MINLGRQSSTAAHWSLQQYESVFAADNLGSSERFILVAEDATEERLDVGSCAASTLVAFLVARRVDKEWELENIVVAEKFRHQSIGSGLLTEFVAHARAEHGSGIFLEVRASNQSARALYQGAGFEEKGLRKAYYETPMEDAILYRLRLY